MRSHWIKSYQLPPTPCGVVVCVYVSPINEGTTESCLMSSDHETTSADPKEAFMFTTVQEKLKLDRIYWMRYSHRRSHRNPLSDTGNINAETLFFMPKPHSIIVSLFFFVVVWLCFLFVGLRFRIGLVLCSFILDRCFGGACCALEFH